MEEARRLDNSSLGSPPYEVVLLGGPRLYFSGKEVGLSPSEGVFLGVVGCSGIGGISRNRLLSLLWQKGTDHQLRRRLSQVLYSFRARLPHRSLIRSDADRLQLDLTICSSDLEKVETAIEERRLDSMVGMLQASLLSGLATGVHEELEKWIRDREAALRSRVRLLAAKICTEAEQEASWREVAEATGTLLCLDPRNEGALRKLIRALALAGRTNEAEAALVNFRDRVRASDPTWEPQDETVLLMSRLLRAPFQSSDPDSLRSEAPSCLVGREKELSQLLSFARESSASRVRVIRVVGEQGVGKTALIRAGLEQLHLDGMKVVVCQSEPLASRMPFGSLARILSSPLVRPAIQSLPDVQKAALATFLADQVRSPDAAAVKAVERFRLSEACLETLEATAGDDPLILFLDRVDRMDRWSLSVLAHVVARWTREGFALFLEYDEAELLRGSILERWTMECRTSGHDDLKLHLDPLSLEQIRTIFARDPKLAASRQADELAELTLGIPSIAVECGRHFNGSLINATSGGNKAELPESISFLVGLRLSRLSPKASEALVCLSLATAPLPPTILASALGVSVAHLDCPLGELTTARLATVNPAGVQIAGRLLAGVVRGSVSTGTQMGNHLRLAEALKRLLEGSRIPEIAHHLLEAGEAFRAMPYVIRGARQWANEGSLTLARELLQRAASSHIPAASVGTLKSLLAEVLVLEGEFVLAEESWNAAAEAYRAQDDPRRAIQCGLEGLRAGILSHRPGLGSYRRRAQNLRLEAADRGFKDLVARGLEIGARISDALQESTGVRDLTARARRSLTVSTGRARLELLSVCMIEAVYGAPDRAVSSADQALEIAGRLRDDDTAFRALNWKIMALYHQARLNSPDGREAIAQALELSSGSRDLGQRFCLEANIGVWHMDSGDYPAADLAFNRASRIIDRIPAPHLRRNLFLNQAQLELENRDHLSAERAFLKSLEAERAAPSGPAKAAAIAGLGICALGSGNISRAKKLHARLPSPPYRWSFDPYLWLWFDAELHMRLGRPSQALDLLDAHEAALKLDSRMTWIRLKLLGLGLAERWDLRPIVREDVTSLAAILASEDLPARRKELYRLTSARTFPGDGPPVSELLRGKGSPDSANDIS